MADGKMCFIDRERVCEQTCRAYEENKTQPCSLLSSVSRLATLATPSRPVAPPPKVKP